ncbi:MAG TPA: Hsp70 family protein [Kofleriaceae bacterium]|nr:Hsp70 family protein [Kofleriaceae bacterium]
MSDPIVGIDLGTSNTVVAYAAETGAVSVLADEQAFKIHPSVVSFHPNGGVVVGAAAKQRKVIDPKNTIYSVKRLIGRSYASPEVQTAKSRVPYAIKEGPNQQPIVATRGGEFAVPEISAIVLDYARNIASHSLGKTVSRAVVTVPASFNDAQRSATATAGAIAGLTVVRVLNEPTAAALAYGNTRTLREVIAVYDFGGGTFDITILKLDNQVYEVLGTAGDTFLGGDDLDERLVDRMVEKFLLENRLDLRTNEVAMMRLRAVAEQTKIELSRRSRAVVRIDEIAYGAKGKPLDLQIEITRDEFVRQCADIIDRTFPVCQEALAYANLGVDKIDDVILVGGTTKIPYVRDQVARFFSRAPRTDVNPEDAVAHGAALQATSLERILKRTSGTTTIPEEASKPTIVADLEITATQTSPSEYPIPQATNERDDDELKLQPPAGPRGRVTAGYATVTRRETERPGARGEHHDTFGAEQTPTPMTMPIGRVTKTMQAPAANPTPPTIPVPKTPTTAPGVEMPPRPRTPPAGVPTVPSSRATPPAGMPAQKLPPALTPTRTKTARTSPVGVPIAPTAPPPAGRAQAPSVPPTFSPTRPQPQAPPQTATRPAAQPPPLDPTTAAWLDEPSQSTDLELTAPPPPPPPRATASPNAKTLLGEQAMRPSQLPTMVAEPQPSRPPLTPLTPPQAPTLIAEPRPRAFPQHHDEPAHAFTEPTRPSAQPLPEAPISPGSTARGFTAAPGNTEPSMTPASTARGFGALAAAPAPVVIDVTPRSLGVGTVAGYCEELIRRNARVPTETRKLFTTSRDGQESVRIIVCQGESRRLDSNVVLGDLMLQGLTPKPRGEVTIEVTFVLDASGILQVRARDAQTGREQHASLDLVGAMPQQEVAASRERMQQLRR